MTTYHEFNSETGIFTGRSFTTNTQNAEEFSLANAEQGCSVIAGHFDSMCQRVDVATGDVVDWQPPQPSSEHEWDTVTRRWRLTEQAKTRVERIEQARTRILNLESGQHRAIRETMLGYDGAKNRLQAIDDEIAQLRKQLTP